MIREKNNYTKAQIAQILNDNLIDVDSSGVLPTYLQIEKELFKKCRIFQYSHNDVLTHLFLVQITSEENTFVSIYNFSDNKKINEKQLFDFIDFCFQELCSQKLSVEIYDDENILLNSYLKMGFEVEGIFKKHILIKSLKRDVYRLALSKNNFNKFIKDYIPKVLKGHKFNINIGDEYSENRIITEEDIRNFALISGDYNPIHLNEKYAKAQGLNSTIAHGILSASFISKVLGMDFPGNGSIYLSQELKFVKPIYPNVDVLIKVQILSIVGKKVTLLSQVLQNNQIAIQGIAIILSSQ